MASSHQPPPNGVSGSPDPPGIKLNGTGGGADSGCSSVECGSGGEVNGSGSSASSGHDNADLKHLTGHCKWFNVLKGFGFITPDDSSEDIFAHQSVLQMPGFRSLDAGEHVQVECKRTQRGWEATRVTAVDEAATLRGSRVHPLGKKKFAKIRCFNCGRYGNHVAGKCPVGPLDKCCYFCHSKDHLIAACPQKQKDADEADIEAPPMMAPEAVKKAIDASSSSATP